MINFVKLFDNFKVDYTTKRNRNWTNTYCPYCGDSYNHYQLGFSDKEEFCSCWKCGWHPVDEALSYVLKIPKKEVNKILSQYRNGYSKNKKINNVKKIELPHFGFTDMEYNYLVSRHFNPNNLQKKFKVNGGGEVGRWAYRIILPFFYKGTLISWTGRSILSKETCEELEIPRYYNLSVEESVLNPKEYWFNSDNASKDSVIIVEGPFDALRLEDDCISGWGSTITEKQKLYLVKNYKKVYLLFDNDNIDGKDTGEKKSIKLKKELEALGLEVQDIGSYLKEFNRKDPGELTYSEVREIKKRCDL